MFAEFEFVKDGGFAGSIKAKHQTASFAVLEPFLEDPEETTHELSLLVGHLFSRHADLPVSVNIALATRESRVGFQDFLNFAEGEMPIRQGESLMNHQW
jgi:hypothetical protein